MLEKLILATVTPFKANKEVDFENLEHLLAFWRSHAISQFFICGTTGEMLSMTVDERKKMAEYYLSNKQSKEQICVHIGGVQVDDVIDLGNHAFDKGADSVSIVTPHYYKISQHSLAEFFRQAIKGISLEKDIYLYNIPQCSGNDLLPETLAQLVQEFPNIKGLKYSFFDMNRTQQYLFAVPKECTILSGTDHMAAALSMLGVHGIVTGAASVYPEIFVAYLEAVYGTNKQKVLEMQEIVTEIVDILGYGNMSIFKELLHRRGLCGPTVRSPLCPLTNGEKIELFKKIESWEEIAS